MFFGFILFIQPLIPRMGDPVMLIDWMSLSLRREDAEDWAGWSDLMDFGDRIQRVNVKTGEVVWETSAWDSVRSDSHQIVVNCSPSRIRVQGSPARVMGDGDAVFGAGDLGRHPLYCSQSMLDFVAKHLRLSSLPGPCRWHCTRMDVTKNFYMGSLPNVRVALAEFRGIEGGRYRVSQQAGDTVYWSHLSKLRSGKAYAKGPHIRHATGKKDYVGREYSAYEISLIDSLLRLELKLGSVWFGRLPVKWYELEWQHLSQAHDDYFNRMVGDVEVTDMSYYDLISKVSETTGKAKAVSATWAMIQTMGWQAVREVLPPRTWYRHLSVLRAAGFGDADISAGRIVSLRRKVVMMPVSSWDDLKRAA